MTKIYIDAKVAPVTEIAWVNQYAREESIALELQHPEILCIRDEESVEINLYIADLDKLIAALQKAKELGWDKS